MGHSRSTAAEEKPSGGCGFRALYITVFRRWGSGAASPRGPSSSTSSTPRSSSSADLKRRRAGSDQASLLAKGPESTAPAGKPRGTANSQVTHQQKVSRRPLEPTAKPTLQNRLAAPPPSFSGELDSVIYDHQRVKGDSTLVRASSSNVMLFGNLGNLQSGNPRAAPARNMLGYLPKTAKEMESDGKTKQSSRLGGGNAGMDKSNNAKEPSPVTCRVLSKRLQPEELKDMGDSEYRQGRFAEALLLYEQATGIDPGRAMYWDSKAAALTGLGRFLEAVAECREAVKIEPNYCKAHHRLATLYLRLGEADKAMYHYKQAGNEASTKEMAQARSLHSHLTKCTEARKRRDWHNVLSEAQSALSTSANSAPQISIYIPDTSQFYDSEGFASQAEALLKLQRHEEAESALIDAPTFDVEASTNFFGVASSAYVLAIRAQVDVAAGRFDDAVSRAQRAAQIDPSDREIATVARKTRAISLARTKGNDLFKASKYEEACVAYREGLDHDPQNSILLCNRAACRSKLGQWEKAIEDCNLALNMRPSYKKARLRRADCYAKLERWEESIQDYEVLVQEMPGDEEVLRSLAEVRGQLEERDGESTDQNFRANLVDQRPIHSP